MLVEPETGQLAHRRNIFFFDVLNPEFRQWWVDTVAKGVAESDCDGAFIDQMHGFAWLRKNKRQEVEKAMGEMMASLKEKMGPDKILLGNNANQAIAKYVFPVIDANMFEHYNERLLSKESLLQDWKDMLRIAKAGKMSIFRIGVESRPQRRSAEKAVRGRTPAIGTDGALAKERLEYYLACYLMVHNPIPISNTDGVGHSHPDPCRITLSCTSRLVLPRGLISEPLRRDGNLPANLNTPAFG